jgi:cell division control protein 6
MEDLVKDLDDIFGEDKPRILVDAQALSPDYVPNQLIGRTAEIKELVKIFSPLDYKGYPSNAIVSGYTGSGKTVGVKFFFEKLMERMEKRKLMDHALKWVYIPCKKYKGENEVLYEIIRQLNKKTSVPKTGWTASRYYDALYEQISDLNISIIVVLDEIDNLRKEDNLLYNLSRAGESHSLPDRHFLTIVGISNQLDYGEELDPRVKSSTIFKNVYFHPYNYDQIKAILCDRVKVSFYKGAISNETVELCAAISAKSHGDARKAIELLRAASLYAEENGFSEVLPEHIDKAMQAIGEDKIMKFATMLPLHGKLVLLAILKNLNYNKFTTNVSEVTKMYYKLCDELDQERKMRTTVSNKISELEVAGLIKVVSMKRGRGAGGRVVELNVDSAKILEDMLYQDGSLEDLKDVKVAPFGK